MKSFHRLIYFLLIFFLFSFSACSKGKKNNSNENSIELHVKQAPGGSRSDVCRNWRPSLKKICLILGYGYNDKEFIEKVETQLSDKFGFDKDGGVVLLYIFPDDFKYAGVPRISLLSDMLENKNIEGIIILGAPEYTYNVLLKIREYGDTKMPYSVFSLFPQDDVLGIEAASDFVLEHAQTDQILGDTAEEQAVTVSDDVYSMIESCIYYMQFLKGPLAQDENLHSTVQKIIGEKNSISRYRDPETGLQSINHFVLNSDN